MSFSLKKFLIFGIHSFFLDMILSKFIAALSIDSEAELTLFLKPSLDALILFKSSVVAFHSAITRFMFEMFFSVSDFDFAKAWDPSE